ncbi:MAG: zinc-ribbon domain-containing protein [Candidatus Hodarchaeota archaeon]
MPNCPHCNTPISEDQNFCSKCGSELQSSDWTAKAKTREALREAWVVGNLVSYDIKKGISWLKTIGVIISLGFLDFTPTYYQADLIFTYYVDGVKYQAKTKSQRYTTARSFTLGEWRKNPKVKAVEDIQERYAKVRVYINPKNPNQIIRIKTLDRAEKLMI